MNAETARRAPGPRRVLVLGSGMVGSVIATDLAADADLHVTAVDSREGALAHLRERAERLGVGERIETKVADLASAAVVTELARGADVVSGAMASGIALAAMRAVIEAGKPYCDISFMAEDFGELDALAKQRGVTVVPDCGVAPGMSHILAARTARMLDRCDELEIYVGGLPVVRTWPFDYKAAFSPADVIEEYTRPARLVEHGKVVTKPALSEPELINLPGVGTLEAFNTDGLRSLTTSLRVPMMREKTLRYPGHIALMAALRHMGLFDERPVTLASGVKVSPRELVSTLMFLHWQYQPGEADLTVMRVTGSGVKDGKACRVTWDVLDHLDADTGTTSMARTTAFPCAIVTRLLARGEISQRGVLPPETLAGMDGVFHTLLREQLARGVRYECSVE